MTSNKLSGIWSLRSELLYKICYHIQYIFGWRDYVNPVLEVEKCRESIRCKSIEIAQLNDSNEESNKSIKCLETTINNLNKDIERLKKLHADEISNKVNTNISIK